MDVAKSAGREPGRRDGSVAAGDRGRFASGSLAHRESASEG